MSESTLRTLFASIPEPAVEAFFYGLRLAGWVPDESDQATTAAPASRPHEEASL
jgi:hypothetical protein